MARSQRTNSGRDKVHFPKEPRLMSHTQDDGSAIWRIEPICGEKYVSANATSAAMPEFHYSSYQSFSTDPMDHRMCSACQSKALHKRDGGKFQGYKIGERLDFSAPEFKYDYKKPCGGTKWGLQNGSWKSVYPVIDISQLADEEEDRIVGFIAIDTGWGKAWEIHGWTSNTEDSAAPRMDPGAAKFTRVSEEYKSLSGTITPRRETVCEARGLNSKELALTLIPDMMERKQLPSHRSIVEATAAWIEQKRVNTEEREKASAERLARLARDREEAELDRSEIAEALREIATTELTNFQRDGLMRAAKRLGIDMDQPATMTEVMVSDEDFTFNG